MNLSEIEKWKIDSDSLKLAQAFSRRLALEPDTDASLICMEMAASISHLVYENLEKLGGSNG